MVELEDREFRAYIEPKSSDRLVVVSGEYGNSYWGQHDSSVPNPALVRAHVIRDFVDPEASLLYMTGDAIGEQNLGLSPQERKKLRQGSAAPLADRVHAAIDAFPNAHEIDRGTGVGMSLGAVTMSHMMREGGSPVNSWAIVEAPNVARRQRPKMVADFMNGGGHLAENIRLNAHPSEDSPVVDEHLLSVDASTGAGRRGMLRYFAGFALKNTYAQSGPLLQPTLGESIDVALSRQENVVHVWGTQDEVSPPEANRWIRDHEVRPSDRYFPLELSGDYARHPLTNAYVLMGAVARRAAR